MILVWSCPPPPIVTRWAGFDNETRAEVQANPYKPLAAVIGPPGPPGAKGEDGAAQMPAVISGGNF